ncbi:MAG TPA: putative Ig domain-containing protein [Terriglobales bacterium]|jgi:hypothetical protein
MRTGVANQLWVLFFLAVLPLIAQQPSASDSVSISTKELPKALLWEPYTSQLEASGGNGPYHWRVLSGTLPHTIQLNDQGELTGNSDESGSYDFRVLVTDNSNPPKQQEKAFTLSTEVPLTADWQRKAQVAGQRIEGSIKVSNRTGRDFDLTFIVLAVNEIGRATAIGYQHFSLKRDTKDMELPFGDTLAQGNYAVNVDVVGEEPISNKIFRDRLASQLAITQGP